MTRTRLSMEALLAATLICLFAVFTTSAGLDNGWSTHVDTLMVESVREKREINQPATESPVDGTTPPHNETELEYNNNKYYAVDFRDSTDEQWVDITNLGSPPVIVKALSSSSNRRALRVPLNFTYPFYGNDVNSLLITSNGFLYLGSYTHSHLAATQYVAPLMADFDPSLDVASRISYYRDKLMFVVEWRDVRLRDDTTGQKFTFQAVLYKNGTTVFSYKEKPISIATLYSENHPVKVGFSDAYYNDTWIFEPTAHIQRTIYKYDALEVPFSKADEFETIVFTPMEMCTDRTTCEKCTQSPPPGFLCTWCDSLNRCSDGVDRHRQSWLKEGCDRNNQTRCPKMNPVEKGKSHFQ